MLKIVGCWVNGITCGSNHSQNGTDSCRETCSQFHDGHTVNKKSKLHIRHKTNRIFQNNRVCITHYEDQII